MGQGSAASLHTDGGISKWDIFYYVYGLLHHPEYRTKYAANLRRELPRIPIVGDADTFWKFSDAGKQLAELHVNYESQKEYPLEEAWVKGSILDLRVEKMKLTKDKAAIVYNDKLTLRGIPAEAFDYRLGPPRRTAPSTGSSTNTKSRPTNAQASRTTPTATTTNSIFCG